MAQKGRKGIVARWLEGKERSEEYARNSLPTNRWSLFWDIFKGRFGKLVLINLLVFITFLPLIAVYLWRSMLIMTQNAIGPYGSGLTVGYPSVPTVAGVAEWSLFQMDILFFALFILSSVIAAVGISGGMYIIRNLLWTEGIFVANDFLRGIKRNYLNVLEAVLIFTILLYFTQTMQNLSDYNIAVGADSSAKVWLTVSKVIGYVFTALSVCICFWMISLGVNYKQGPWALFRNAVVITFGMFPQTIFFIAIGLIPFFLVLFTSGFFMVIGVLMLLFMSFSFIMLVWMDFSQWTFDRFINPNMGVGTGRGLYNRETGKMGGDAQKPAQDSAAMREYRRMIVAQGRSKLVCRPIKPIDDELELYQLPESFSREDLQKLRESKEKMEEDVKTFEEEHKNDEQYVEYNKQFDERERMIQEEESGGKSKKKKKAKHPPKMLNKR